MKSVLPVAEDTLGDLKRYFAVCFPTMRTAHRTELAARALGYRTYASLLAALRDGPLLVESVDSHSAIEFIRKIGFEADLDEVTTALRGVFGNER